MKNVQSTMDPSTVRRVTDERAERMVRTVFWKYAPKKTKDADGKLVPTFVRK